MSIYKLKIGFLDFLKIFGCSQGSMGRPYQNIMFWALKMKF